MSDRKPAASERVPAGGTETDGAFKQWFAETRRALGAAEDVRIEVFVRSLLPPPGAKESQSSVLRELRRAVDGTPARLSVEVWGERICRCEDCRGTDVGRGFIDRVERLAQWGDHLDASAEEFFEYTEVESSVTGSTYEGIRPPRVTTALYADDRIVGVFPNRLGDRSVSVADFVELVQQLTTGESLADRSELSI